MNNDFGEITVYTGQEIAEQKAESGQFLAPTVSGNIEQSRAVAEAQASMVVAKSSPRDEMQAYQRIIKACKRKSLAERATYAYKRGGALVTGPSIRLAEVLARHWGNISFGLRELSRRAGESEMEAFAWDLETNTKVIRGFTVKHIREKKVGNVGLDSERDVYELTANQGQRRVRACILELIPGDIVEAAEDQCKKTIEHGDGTPLEDRIRKMIAAFDEQGVTKDMIEGFLGHKAEAMVAQQLVRLTEIYRSIRDGIGKREDFFRVTTSAPEKAQDAPEPPTEPAAEEPAQEPAIEMITDAQVKKLNTVLGSLGNKDNAGKKQVINNWLETVKKKPPVTSSKELARADASELIDALEREAANLNE